MFNVAEEMKQLNALARSTQARLRKPLWNLMTRPEWLAQAWEEIRRNKGSRTAGIDGMIAVDVDLSLIHKLSEELKNKTYRPTPVRRVLIPKANGKTRPLGISTLKDRIVQQAIKMLLEPIFEADFFYCSHGFRQGKSTITALRDTAHFYPMTSWIIEGDIEGCYDNIPRGKLLEVLGKRVADENVLSLIKDFLKAGYMEDWKYHQTYSGVPQGNIVGPLLCNIFLHQFDEFMMKELDANRIPTRKEINKRRNPEYAKLSSRLEVLRGWLKAGKGNKDEIIKSLGELERQRKVTPYYKREVRHPGKVWYVRYADDFLVLIAGTKEEATAIRERVKVKLSEMGLKLSEGKTKITHWSRRVNFLGYQIKGKISARGVGIRAVLIVPQEKVRKVRDALKKVSGYYHIPEADAMSQMSAIFRGWCNYYRYANNPQPIFGKVSSFMWWRYAHLKARKHKSSIKAMIVREKKSGGLGKVQWKGRQRNTFQLKLEKRTLTLDIFPPKTQRIRAVTGKQKWEVDLRPVTPLHWQSGRSLTTQLAALDRAHGVCERCGEKPITHVHHSVPLKGKSFLARIRSDRDQRYTAQALCYECHLAAHGGSFKGKAKRSGWNAGYAERCSSSVGSAG